VIGTVRGTGDLDAANRRGIAGVVTLDIGDPAAAVREAAGGGVDRIVEVAIGDPLPLGSAAEAHERVDAGARSRVLLRLPG
jgi:hypothetical protein